MSRILLVNRDDDDRAMYAEYLATHAYDVVEAGSTDAAVEFIPSCDLLITGLTVRGVLPAVELIAGARLGTWGRQVPVIVVTACILGNLHNAAIDAGASRVLLKPCLPETLLDIVRQTLPDGSFGRQH